MAVKSLEPISIYFFPNNLVVIKEQSLVFESFGLDKKLSLLLEWFNGPSKHLTLFAQKNNNNKSLYKTINGEVVYNFRDIE